MVEAEDAGEGQRRTIHDYRKDVVILPVPVTVKVALKQRLPFLYGAQGGIWSTAKCQKGK